MGIDWADINVKMESQELASALCCSSFLIGSGTSEAAVEAQKDQVVEAKAV